MCYTSIISNSFVHEAWRLIGVSTKDIIKVSLGKIMPLKGFTSASKGAVDGDFYWVGVFLKLGVPYAGSAFIESFS